MKYLKRFNESQNNYSSYEDVISILEEVKYNLEVSFDYDVDVSYNFRDFDCILIIKAIGWKFYTDPTKSELLDQEVIRIEKMFQPYQKEITKMEQRSVEGGEVIDLIKINIKFNLLCQKCKNQEQICPNCHGNKKILCGCEGSGIENCYQCQGDGYIDDYSNNCQQCGGNGEQTCEWCQGDGETECNVCDGQGYVKCRHEWL